MLAKEIQSAVRAAVTEAVECGDYNKYHSKHAQQLERELPEILSQEHCLLTSSGSAAVLLALKACGLQSGDEVILSGYDYPGNFWAIEQSGATPVLLDTKIDSWGICETQLQNVLRAKHQCRAIIVSHLHGEIQDTRKLREILAEHNIPLIEDCCQAFGAHHGGIPLGSDADFSIVSFGGGKVVSCGRGGALLCNQSQLFQKAIVAAGTGSGPFQLSELQAAAVRAQLPFLDSINRQTQTFFAAVAQELSLQMASETDLEMCPQPVDFSLNEQQLGIYQAGWLACSNSTFTLNAAPSQAQSAVKRIGRSLGHGFPGFHRRSSRRCRKPNSLEQVQSIALRTCVVHHRLALEEDILPVQVASELKTILLHNA